MDRTETTTNVNTKTDRMPFLSKLFRKKPVLDPIDLSLVGTDMHSHLIPGIDDGAPNTEISIDLIRKLMGLGYSKFITTPHIMSDYYRNTSEGILRGLDGLREALQKENISVPIEAAAEYFLDEHFEKLIQKKDILTFGDNYVLFELSFMIEPASLKKVLFELQMAGYKPILAHPERYPYWHKDFDKFRELVDRDVFLQLNLNSLTGTYSPQVQKCGEQLIKEGLVSFLGSDCHHHGHIQLSTEVRTNPSLHQLISSGKLMNQSL
jgi:protein-tyrosine phosphatase